MFIRHKTDKIVDIRTDKYIKKSFVEKPHMKRSYFAFIGKYIDFTLGFKVC